MLKNSLWNKMSRTRRLRI